MCNSLVITPDEGDVIILHLRGALQTFSAPLQEAITSFLDVLFLFLSLWCLPPTISYQRAFVRYQAIFVGYEGW